MPIKICSICSADPPIRESIERMQKNKMRYGDIAAQTSFSKTAIWRHCTRHAPKSILETSSRCFQSGDDLFIAHDTSPETLALYDARQREIAPARLWLILISYEPAMSKESVDAHHAHTERIVQAKTIAGPIIEAESAEVKTLETETDSAPTVE